MPRTSTPHHPYRTTTAMLTTQEIIAMGRHLREQKATELVPGLTGIARENWVEYGNSWGDPDNTTDTKETTMATTTATKKSTKKELPENILLPITTRKMAEAAGVTPKTLRIFLRANSETFPKPEGQRQYGWKSLTSPQAKKLIKAVKTEA